jgi:plastocyanin
MTRAARWHCMGAIARGAILPVVSVFIVLPATASAAVTRPVQAVDGVGTHYWVPNALAAQQGDTIEWRFTQPGNTVAAQHDVWIVPPGGTATPVGAQYQAPTAQTTVAQVGTYQFYCSIHGGLAPGGMNGTITVGAGDPGPPVDPGQAWLTAPPPTSGPQPALNPFALPDVYETGDTTPPSVSIRSVDGVRRGARLRVRVSEPSTLSVRLEDSHKKVLATRRLRVAAGTKTFTIRTRARIETTRARVRITARDSAQLETSPRLARVWIGD